FTCLTSFDFSLLAPSCRRSFLNMPICALLLPTRLPFLHLLHLLHPFLLCFFLLSLLLREPLGPPALLFLHLSSSHLLLQRRQGLQALCLAFFRLNLEHLRDRREQLFH